MPTLRDEAEVERSVCEALYGERAEVRTVSRTADPLGMRIGGRYRLLERIGAGGMGTVYRARDERLKRDVAVKFIAERRARDRRAVRRFRLEAEIGARLSHANIVGVLDAGSAPREFIVMDLIHGTDVTTLVRRQGRLVAAEVVHLIAQICDALSYTHKRGVVHCDVSPRNMLVEPVDLTARLGDFGVAFDARAAPAAGWTRVAGTPGYVAPELLRGAPPSPRSDLYSLGLVTHRLLAGRAVEDPDATGAMVTACPRVPRLATIRPNLPPGLCAAVDQALARDPSDRQTSVAEFREHIVCSRRATVVALPRAA